MVGGWTRRTDETIRSGTRGHDIRRDHARVLSTLPGRGYNSVPRSPPSARTPGHSYPTVSRPSPSALQRNMRCRTARRNRARDRRQAPRGHEHEYEHRHNQPGQNHATSIRPLDLIEADGKRLATIIGTNRLHTSECEPRAARNTHFAANSPPLIEGSQAMSQRPGAASDSLILPSLASTRMRSSTRSSGSLKEAARSEGLCVAAGVRLALAASQRFLNRLRINSSSSSSDIPGACPSLMPGATLPSKRAPASGCSPLRTRAASAPPSAAMGWRSQTPRQWLKPY